MSSEELLVKRSVAIPQRFTKNGLNVWEAIGISLNVKINCVADYLNPDPAKKGQAVSAGTPCLALEDSRGPDAVWTL